MAITRHSKNVLIIDNCTFAYCKLAEAGTKYNSEDREYSVDVIVDKETYKQWNKLFSKQKGKEIDKEEFEAKYKITLPEGEDEAYVIKLKKAASKDGVAFDEKFRPKVILNVKGENVDITTSRLISNGSKGKVGVYVTENSFGTFGKLNSVYMEEKDFIEFKSAGGVGSEFGGVSTTEPTNTAVTQARARKEAAKPSVDDSEEYTNFEDDIPF